MKFFILTNVIVSLLFVSVIGCGDAGNSSSSAKSDPKLEAFEDALKKVAYLTSKGGGGKYSINELVEAVNKAGEAGAVVNGADELKSLLAEWESLSSDSRDLRGDTEARASRAKKLAEKTDQMLK